MPFPNDKLPEPFPLGPIAGTQWTVLETVPRTGARSRDRWWVRVRCSCGVITERSKVRLSSINRPRMCEECFKKERKKHHGFVTKAMREGADPWKGHVTPSISPTKK